ncbi:MAG: DUF1800 domain-containing protein [Phycisphaerales bacterium]|nr:DUF1800 domain-containing protein [Phycisphaerae bacterium]NNF41908.1 DUF1800 domain-containing protein [Phycisphaerales bacterium]NNM25524.1 DUF1800 domain-containing protein [Phycisphaerales bacterium]
MAQNDTLQPLPPERFDYWHALHLVNRAGFGTDPSHVHHFAQIGVDAAVDFFVRFSDRRFTAVAPDDFDADLLRPATEEELRQTRRARERGDEATIARIRRDRVKRSQLNRTQMIDFQRWWLRRMMETPRPLEERMVLFWHGHFASSFHVVRDSYHMFQQNRLFREHAIGDVRALTHGVIRDPAMLKYLNNNLNRKERPNENLARELLELFTLGDGRGYTERDIKEGARSLTGYSFDDDAFRRLERYHDGGTKTIFGRTGTWDGDDFVDLIFRERDPAPFLCEKLYRYFVNDLPNGVDADARAAIDAMAHELRSHQYYVGPMLGKLFRSAHFYDARHAGAQIKSPIQLLVQTRRSLETPIRDLDAQLAAARLMGQTLGYPPSVQGWTGGRAWINTATMFVRQNLLLYLLTGRRSAPHGWKADRTPFRATGLVAHLESTLDHTGPEEVATYLLQITVGRLLHPDRASTLTQFLEQRGGRIDDATITDALALIAVMPEFQLC